MQGVSACKKEDRALRSLRVKRPQQSCGTTRHNRRQQRLNRPDRPSHTHDLAHDVAPLISYCIALCPTHIRVTRVKRQHNGLVRSEFHFPVSPSHNDYLIVVLRVERASVPPANIFISFIRFGGLVQFTGCTASRVPRASARGGFSLAPQVSLVL
jgi:hypothetical protein